MIHDSIRSLYAMQEEEENTGSRTFDRAASVRRKLDETLPSWSSRPPERVKDVLVAFSTSTASP